MAKQVQLRRGTTAQNDAFIGAQGEVTVDTDKNTLRVHDGKTLGGTVLARQGEVQPFPTNVPESDAPNSVLSTVAIKKEQNGYVKFGNGLIIQWGIARPTTASITVHYPIAFTMSEPIITNGQNDKEAKFACSGVSKTSFVLNSSVTGSSYAFRWIAVGY